MPDVEEDRRATDVKKRAAPIRFAISEEFMRNFRWITPLMLTVCSLALSILLWVGTQVVGILKDVKVEMSTMRGDLNAQLRAGRDDSIAYTDKMVGIATAQQKEFKQEVREEFAEVKHLIKTR